MKFKFPFNVLTILLFFGAVSCEKDDPIKPYNELNGRTTAIFNPEKQYGKVIDIEGNAYKTIVIGEQTWMAENLRTTKYRNGDAIPNITEYENWINLTSDAYCNYNNTSNLDTIATYGRLYNWYAAADARNIAPKGWRVPTITDWTELFDYLGGVEIAGNKLKEVGTLHWEDPYQSDNSSGFTALPGGWCYKNKKFSNIGFFGNWWTASEYNAEKAGFLFMFDFSADVSTGINFKPRGYSIRCIKE